MSSESRIVIGFDLYGTLLSTESIAKELATHFGEAKAQVISASWRRYQLEYTWRLNSMGIYKPFSDVTHASLQHALSESKVFLSDDDTAKLMNAYDSLDVFPDVPPALKALVNESNIDAYVFSNGSDAMVSSSMNHSPSLSPHAAAFNGYVTVGAVKAYKPTPSTYQHLVEKVGKKGDVGNVWLVSGNPFDIVGARSVGMQAAWVARSGEWVDRLGDLANGGPTIVVKGVDEAVKGIQKWTQENAEGKSDA